MVADMFKPFIPFSLGEALHLQVLLVKMHENIVVFYPFLERILGSCRCTDTNHPPLLSAR